jgi:DNA ligase D-like protein (predicted 3'-phosphoesterase)
VCRTDGGEERHGVRLLKERPAVGAEDRHVRGVDNPVVVAQVPLVTVEGVEPACHVDGGHGAGSAAPTAAAGGYCRYVRATRFVAQLHDATTLHFDLRIQAGEVLRSWAVPKGPSLDPAVRRLAVPVEDHALSAGEFEGVHGGQVRGSGAVIIWDEGTAEITRDEPGHLTFTLHGSKLAGGFALTRTGERRWILVKTRDATARPGSDIVAEGPASVRTGRTWEQVATEAGPSSSALRSPGSTLQSS